MAKLRKVSRPEVRQRGCLYCLHAQVKSLGRLRTIFDIDGDPSSAAIRCPFDRCPFRELDNIRNYKSWADSRGHIKVFAGFRLGKGFNAR